MDSLRLLSGDAQTFLDKIWASHVHVHHANPEDLVGLLSLDDVDALLTSTALRTPALRIAQEGRVLPSSSYTRSASISGAPLTGLVDARKVLDLFESGATVVLQGLHRYWPPLSRLVGGLELALGHPCQANAYLTPPASQGFARHSDSHDVFVFQTHGAKLWEVHEGSSPREVLLEPGVSMYLPTGTPHSARSQAAASLHVTVGINQVTWRRVLQSVTTRILDDERYAAAVPAGYLENPGDYVEQLGAELGLLARRVAARSATEVVAEQRRRFLTGRGSMLRGGFADRLAVDQIADDTRLARRPGAVCVLEPAGAVLRVLLGDRELRVPARLGEPIDYLRRQTSFTPGDLEPWLDSGSRLVLVRRLVREGLLRVDR